MILSDRVKIVIPISGDDDSEIDSSPPELTKPASPSPASPFSTPVITTPPTSLLESSAMESITEPMQDDSMTGHVTESINHQNHPQTTEADGTNTVSADLSSFTLTDNENPIFITGDDGTVYQVAGQNEQGQTILLTQGMLFLNFICISIIQKLYHHYKPGL